MNHHGNGHHPDSLTSIDLRALAELAGSERAFVSLYLSSHLALRQLDEQVERTRAFLADSPEEAEHFERSLERIREWLEAEAPAEFEGLVVFASWALDFLAGYVLSLPVKDLLRVEASPYLRPLALLRDEYENFVVVAADNHATRIFLVTAARVEEEDRVRGDVKNRVKKGGWSQKRYARRRDNQLLHYAKDVAERLQELAEEQEFSRIVLLGSEETIHEILEVLPTDLAAKVAGERAANVKEGRDELVEEAFELFQEAEQEAHEALWQRIKEDGLSDGLAATGATRVLAAALVGRVEEMLVDREAKLRGTRCRDCENVVHGTPETCQICGSASVYKVDLVDELVHLVEKTRGHVEFTQDIPGLTRVGDVAALLRY